MESLYLGFVFAACLFHHCNQEGLNIVLNLICHLGVLKICISYLYLKIQLFT